MAADSSIALLGVPTGSTTHPGKLTRHSLRVRLPAAISAFVAIVLTAFLWVAVREVESALVQAGGSRAQGAADQLANLLAQQTQQRMDTLQRVAQSAAVRDYLHRPGDETADGARQRLATLASRGQPPVELWDGAGHQLLAVAGPPGPPGATDVLSRMPAAVPPAAPGAGAYHASNDVVFWDAVAEVRDEAASATDGKRLGWVSSRRVVSSAAASDVISRLVGIGAQVRIGNQSGGVWTDFSKAIPAPRVDVGRNGVAEYRAADNQHRLGANALIRGTPWAVWVDFPRSLIVAPARTFLTRMLVVALFFVVAAAAAARVLSSRITTPLRDLTDAAEAMAAGQDVATIRAGRRDEIGRLGAAFNAMTAQVQSTQRNLETRVQQRTVSLAEAGAALQQRLAELNETRQEIDRFFVLSLDMLCIAGTDGYFKQLNPAWSETLGWTDHELRSRPYLEFVHPDDREHTIQQAGQLAGGTTVMMFENRYACQDGSYRWVQWKAIPSPDRGLIYASARDITSQKAAESRVQALNDQLGERVTQLHALTGELEAFSYSVSHDLRAPLRHVMGFAALLEKTAGPALDEQGRRYVRTIADAATQMGRLIDDLLVFSRMGRTEMRREPVDLAALVEELRNDAAADQTHRRIDWNIHPLPVVKGDPAMLRLVLINLLSNAVKYTSTRPAAEIEVGANGTAAETVLFVRDNGVGFDMQYGHKLFGVFQRLHSADEFEGTGIGLANVSRIVQRHGGRVWAEGAVNAGATFYFSLPTGEGAA